MDFAPAEQAQDLVARLLQRQPTPHGVAMRLGHANGIGKAEEIRRMQQHDMQRVALDPLAAVKQPPQRAQRAGDGDAERGLDRMHGAHLIGHGTDAADSRCDIRCLGAVATTQQRLEESRRLEDRQPHAGYRAVVDIEFERPFAFDAGQVVNANGPGRHAPRSPCGTAPPPR